MSSQDFDAAVIKEIGDRLPDCQTVPPSGKYNSYVRPYFRIIELNDGNFEQENIHIAATSSQMKKAAERGEIEALAKKLCDSAVTAFQANKYPNAEIKRIVKVDA
ncbi:hypothetical protein PSQ19_06060 [Devosia algicola]|uniref:Uncharacterized protein n=1 Tax=Devosia algicola TaxID=3026418 RepID=A0ABY7YR25_9HYPH|nr:hypothetical protein [Devosia algicola]WDR03632.1 hypothetical protein PSQ19_06060 [Devosia algicola]